MESAALRHYEAVKRAQKAYRERKRQMMKDAGIYKGPGRPKKEAVEVKGF